MLVLVLLSASLLYVVNAEGSQAVTAKSLQFYHEGEMYSPTESLNENSVIVAKEKESLLDENELRNFDTDLRWLARFIKIAYNGIAAAGPDYVDLQIEVQHLGYNITYLFDKSVRTLKKFMKTSDWIVVKRQSAYYYVIEGFEEIAVEILSSLADDARKMESAALELVEEFRATMYEAIKTHDKTLSSQKNQENNFRKLEKDRIRAEMTKTEEERRIEVEKKRERRAAKLRVKFEMMENQALRELTSNIRNFKQFVNYASSILGGGNVFTDDTTQIAELLHKFRLEETERENKHREARLEALENIKESALKIRDIDSIFESEESIASAVIDALQFSIGALSNLTEVMMQAASIWGELEDYCNDLVKLQKPMDGVEDYSVDKRLAVWTSHPAKLTYVYESARWFSLHLVSKEFMAKMKLTQKDLHKYIRENPTWEESRKMIKQLANDFLADVEEEKDNIRNSIKKSNEKDGPKLVHKEL